MGLDMYLNKRVFIGAAYDHREVSGVIDIMQGSKQIPIEFSKVMYVVEEAGYWRKANQVHNWFVENVQGGKDDCREYYVSSEQLMRLKEVCEEALRTRNSGLIPPKSGFFFGSTEVDNYYWDDLERTVEILSNLDPNADYFYHSSW